jgi:hypothetical protein
LLLEKGKKEFMLIKFKLLPQVRNTKSVERILEEYSINNILAFHCALYRLDINGSSTLKVMDMPIKIGF